MPDCMKKINFLILIITLLIGSCNNKPVETTVLGMWTDYTLIPNTLKGKVKEMKELNYWAVDKDGKTIKGVLMTKKDLDSIGSTPNLIAHFDDKGTLIKYDNLDGENVIQSEIGTFENGKCTRWDNKLRDSTTYYVIPEYDNQGNLIGAKMYRPLVDTLMNKYVFSNDGKGNITRFEYFNFKNQKTGYHVCSLDEKGNYIEAKYFNKADSLRNVMTNTYDDNDNIIKQQTMIEKTKSSVIWEYKDLKSDDHGNLIEYLANIDNGKFIVFVERSYIYY
jgi:hypothetical protein